MFGKGDDGMGMLLCMCTSKNGALYCIVVSLQILLIHRSLCCTSLRFCLGVYTVKKAKEHFLIHIREFRRDRVQSYIYEEGLPM